MATKYYGINDKWTDDDIENVIEIASEDGTVDSVKVNGEEYGGGGGGDFTTATCTITSRIAYTVVEVFASYILNDNISCDTYSIHDVQEVPITLVLYKGKQEIIVDCEEVTGISGNVTDLGNNHYQVTGNCSIIAKGWPEG